MTEACQHDYSASGTCRKCGRHREVRSSEDSHEALHR